jgi:hypothetical protein
MPTHTSDLLSSHWLVQLVLVIEKESTEDTSEYSEDSQSRHTVNMVIIPLGIKGQQQFFSK